MSYAAVVSVGAKAPVAPAPVAPPLSYAEVTAKNVPEDVDDEDYWGVAPEPVHRCNDKHCELCNMLSDPIGYGVTWTVDEYGNESGT